MTRVVWKSKYGPAEGMEWVIEDGLLILPPGTKEIPDYALYKCGMALRFVDLVSSVVKVAMPTDLTLCCISRWMPEHVVQMNVLKFSTTYWLPRPVQSKHERFSGRFWQSLRIFWYFSSSCARVRAGERISAVLRAAQFFCCCLSTQAHQRLAFPGNAGARWLLF